MGRDFLVLKPNALGLFLAVFLLVVAGHTSQAQVDTIRLALIMPMNAHTTTAKTLSPKDRPVYAFCQGMEVAAQLEQAAGLPVRLHYYDTRGDVVRLDSMLKLPELKKMDAWVGPMYPQGAEKVAQAAQALGIVHINPVNSRRFWPAINAYSFMTTMTPATYGSQAFGYAQSLTLDKYGVIYGTSLKDSLMAMAFKNAAEQAGIKLTIFRKVGKNSAANLPKFLMQAGVDSTTALFAPNDEKNVQLQLPAALLLLKRKASLITYGSWIEDSGQPTSYWKQLNIHFIYPSFADFSKPDFVRFEQGYQRIFHLLPNDDAYVGGECLFQLTKGLTQYGKANLASAWRRGVMIDGRILPYWRFNAEGEQIAFPVYKVVESGNGLSLQLPLIKEE